MRGGAFGSAINRISGDNIGDREFGKTAYSAYDKIANLGVAGTHEASAAVAAAGVEEEEEEEEGGQASSSTASAARCRVASPVQEWAVQPWSW